MSPGFWGDPPRLCKVCGNELKPMLHGFEVRSWEAREYVCLCCRDVEKRKALNEKAGL